MNRATLLLLLSLVALTLACEAESCHVIKKAKDYSCGNFKYKLSVARQPGHLTDLTVKSSGLQWMIPSAVDD